MARSPKMLALFQKLDAADAKHFDNLRESAKRDKQAKVDSKLRLAVRSAQAKKAIAQRKKN